ncbi:STAS domain-containing protein [bacterium]|nr:STAS domain-containing protein [bacterium]
MIGARRELGMLKLNHTIYSKDNLVIVRAEGVINAENAEKFFQYVCSEVENFWHLVIDLGEVTDLDSVGINKLLGLYKMIRNNGGYMALCNASKKEKMFDLLSLNGLIRVFTDEKDAIKYCIDLERGLI